MVNFDFVILNYQFPPSYDTDIRKSLSIKYLFYVFIELFQRISIGTSTPTIVSPDVKIFITACINPSLASESSLS